MTQFSLLCPFLFLHFRMNIILGTGTDPLPADEARTITEGEEGKGFFALWNHIYVPQGVASMNSGVIYSGHYVDGCYEYRCVSTTSMSMMWACSIVLVLLQNYLFIYDTYCTLTTSELPIYISIVFRIIYEYNIGLLTSYHTSIICSGNFLMIVYQYLFQRQQSRV